MIKSLKAEGKRAPNVVLISKDGEAHIGENDAPEKPIIRFRGADG